MSSHGAELPFGTMESSGDGYWGGLHNGVSALNATELHLKVVHMVNFILCIYILPQLKIIINISLQLCRLMSPEGGVSFRRLYRVSPASPADSG